MRDERWEEEEEEERAPLSQRRYAMALVPVRATASMSSKSHSRLSLRADMSAKAPHTAGARYSVVQKTRESVGATEERSAAASNVHLDSPVSLLNDHQRSLTSSLPVTFLTVQKSAAISSRQTMKRKVPFAVIHEPKRYRETAASCVAEAR